MAETVTVFGRVPPATAALFELAVDLVGSTTGTKPSKNTAIIAALEMWSEGVLRNHSEIATAHLALRQGTPGFPVEGVQGKLAEMDLAHLSPGQPAQPATRRVPRDR